MVHDEKINKHVDHFCHCISETVHDGAWLLLNVSRNLYVFQWAY